MTVDGTPQTPEVDWCLVHQSDHSRGDPQSRLCRWVNRSEWEVSGRDAEALTPDCYRCAEIWDQLEPRSWWTVSRMYVCPSCGNKRCPKATDHRLDCTGSNEPGQPGSRYGGLAQT